MIRPLAERGQIHPSKQMWIDPVLLKYLGDVGWIEPCQIGRINARSFEDCRNVAGRGLVYRGPPKQTADHLADTPEIKHAVFPYFVSCAARLQLADRDETL
jgi:hypothetical protein